MNTKNGVEMKNAVETLETIKKSAKTMQQVRVVEGMKIGEVARQGDIYVERVAAIEGKGTAVKSRQLAPGTTKGSRHIVEDSPNVTLWESRPSLNGRASFQIGPAIEAKGDFSVTHPEHAFIKFIIGKATQFFQVWFQADFNRKERAKD